MFIDPANTSSFSSTSFGKDSPVNADTSRVASPDKTTPSRGTFSPALTTMIDPTLTLSGDTLFSSPLRSIKFAKSGLIFIKSDIDFLDLFTA